MVLDFGRLTKVLEGADDVEIRLIRLPFYVNLAEDSRIGAADKLVLMPMLISALSPLCALAEVCARSSH